MSETADPVDVLERELTILARQLTTPRSTECVFCYVDRMLDEFGCDNTLRWAVQWRGMRARGAAGTARRLLRLRDLPQRLDAVCRCCRVRRGVRRVAVACSAPVVLRSTSRILPTVRPVDPAATPALVGRSTPRGGSAQLVRRSARSHGRRCLNTAQTA